MLALKYTSALLYINLILPDRSFCADQLKNEISQSNENTNINTDLHISDQNTLQYQQNSNTKIKDLSELVEKSSAELTHLQTALQNKQDQLNDFLNQQKEYNTLQSELNSCKDDIEKTKISVEHAKTTMQNLSLKLISLTARNITIDQAATKQQILDLYAIEEKNLKENIEKFNQQTINAIETTNKLSLLPSNINDQITQIQNDIDSIKKSIENQKIENDKNKTDLAEEENKLKKLQLQVHTAPAADNNAIQHSPIPSSLPSVAPTESLNIATTVPNNDNISIQPPPTTAPTIEHLIAAEPTIPTTKSPDQSPSNFIISFSCLAEKSIFPCELMTANNTFNKQIFNKKTSRTTAQSNDNPTTSTKLLRNIFPKLQRSNTNQDSVQSTIQDTIQENPTIQNQSASNDDKTSTNTSIHLIKDPLIGSFTASITPKKMSLMTETETTTPIQEHNDNSREMITSQGDNSPITNISSNSVSNSTVNANNLSTSNNTTQETYLLGEFHTAIAVANSTQTP